MIDFDLKSKLLMMVIVILVACDSDDSDPSINPSTVSNTDVLENVEEVMDSLGEEDLPEDLPITEEETEIDEDTGEGGEENNPLLGELKLSRIDHDDCVAPAEPNSGIGDFELESVFPNLPVLNDLIGLYQAPDDTTSWFALLRSGTIVRFENDPTVAAYEVFLQLNGVSTFSEMGLLGMAFHPDYQSNGFVYVYYNDANNDGASTISRFTLNVESVLEESSELKILVLSQPAGNHNGGDIHFGPDGYLYIGLGDGGGSNDQYGHGQNSGSLLGTLLRIDVDAQEAPKNYGIPVDNPFVGNGSFLPEIYAWGIRNPWRWSFDQENGDLWLADVGQNAWEEIHLVSAGENLGWPIMEGKSCFQSSSCNQSGLTLPILDYPHTSGNCAIIGGYVYRADRLTNLNGSYIFADYCVGKIWRAYDDEGWQMEQIFDAPFNVRSFAQGNAGEVYVLDAQGSAGEGIFRLKEVTPGNTSMIPSLLSETGCYASTSDKSLANFVVPYEINSALWSDGAVKSRAFALPDNRSIILNSAGDFIFPEGSVLIKEFLNNDSYLETRLLMRHDDGWQGYSYEWMEDGSDAELLSEGKTIDAGEFVHTFPSPSECETCHTAAANFSLGLETIQLDKSNLVFGTEDYSNQLIALHEAGFLSTDPSSFSISPLVAINDISVSVDARARSYLHSNCSSCHRPEGPADFIDLRAEITLSEMGICNVEPDRGDLGLENPLLLDPGNASQSVLLQRMKTLGGNRMPPLASLVEDNDATAIIETWINTLSTCD